MTSSLAYMQGPNFFEWDVCWCFIVCEVKRAWRAGSFYFSFFPRCGVRVLFACLSSGVVRRDWQAAAAGEPPPPAHHPRFFFAFLNDKNNMRLRAALRAPLK